MHQINEILGWAGFFTDGAFPHVGGFWSTPVGILISITIFICSSINILHPGIDDNVFDRIWYSILALLTFCSAVGGMRPNYEPHNIVKTLVFLIAIRCVASVIQRHRHWKKSGKAQKTLGM